MQDKQDSRTITISWKIKGNGDKGNWLIFITLSMKRLTFLVCGLMSDPNTCNATHICYLGMFCFAQFLFTHFNFIKPFFNRLSPMWKSSNWKDGLSHKYLEHERGLMLLVRRNPQERVKTIRHEGLNFMLKLTRDSRPLSKQIKKWRMGEGCRYFSADMACKKTLNHANNSCKWCLKA